MIIRDPCVITSRLLPGVMFADGSQISIRYSKAPKQGGRVRYEYLIDLPNGLCHEGNDIQSGCHGGTLREGLDSLLAFLMAAAEAYKSLAFHGRLSDNEGLFPDFIMEWAYLHDDELAMLRCMVKDAQGCIEED